MLGVFFLADMTGNWGDGGVVCKIVAWDGDSRFYLFVYFLLR